VELGPDSASLARARERIKVEDISSRFPLPVWAHAGLASFGKLRLGPVAASVRPASLNCAAGFAQSVTISMTTEMSLVEELIDRYIQAQNLESRLSAVEHRLDDMGISGEGLIWQETE